MASQLLPSLGLPARMARRLREDVRHDPLYGQELLREEPPGVAHARFVTSLGHDRDALSPFSLVHRLVGAASVLDIGVLAGLARELAVAEGDVPVGQCVPDGLACRLGISEDVGYLLERGSTVLLVSSPNRNHLLPATGRKQVPSRLPCRAIRFRGEELS